jgi:hypothetical protein
MVQRGPELDCGTRAIIAFIRMPLRDISQQVNIPKSTCGNVRRHAAASAKRTKLPIYHEVNQTPYIRVRRPKSLFLREEDILILQVTFNKEQRAKSWVCITAEIGLKNVFR